MIDSQQASEALTDIDQIMGRVRQSQTYNLASLSTILWGVLVFAGNIATFLWPRVADYAWLSVYAVGIAISALFSALNYPRTGIRTFDVRILAAFLLFIGFGIYVSNWLGHFGPRQLGTFWALYFMLVYVVAGLWIGYAFVVIGVGVSVLTLIGYYYIFGWFEPWMAVVNGGGLILGGFWMRRN